MRNFAIGWWQKITEHKDRNAYLIPRDNQIEAVTYGDWSKQLQRLSVGLIEQGFDSGMRIGFVAQN